MTPKVKHFVSEPYNFRFANVAWSGLKKNQVSLKSLNSSLLMQI